MAEREAALAALLCVALAAPAEGAQQRSRAVTAEFQRERPCPSTGRQTGACPGWIRDHWIALCRGGPDTVANLRWQTVEDAKLKDKWECRKDYAPGVK